jgi:hypothetical protein
LRGDAAIHAFQSESAALIESILKFWRNSSKRLGLSCRKQDHQIVAVSRVFIDVGADLGRLAHDTAPEVSQRQLSSAAAHDPGSGDLDTATQRSRDSALLPDRKQMKARREQRLAAAQARWHPLAKRNIPFSWIHDSAGVDHKDAYDWKSGKLPETSAMSQSIERVLQQAIPPARKLTH